MIQVCFQAAATSHETCHFCFLATVTKMVTPIVLIGSLDGRCEVGCGLTFLLLSGRRGTKQTCSSFLTAIMLVCLKAATRHCSDYVS
jgi:hypothetical protein